jgi:hypothetical protein
VKEEALTKLVRYNTENLLEPRFRKVSYDKSRAAG